MFGLVAFSAFSACDDSDGAPAELPGPSGGGAGGGGGDAGESSSPQEGLDASTPEGDRDASADAADSGSESPPALTCGALSSDCPFLLCEEPASTLAAATARCSSPPYVRSVSQGSACGRTFVAYRYGAGDTAIAFFDTASGELTGWWNESDTGALECSGEVDASCAKSTESSLPAAGGCPADAGAPGADAGTSGSG